MRLYKCDRCERYG